MGVLPVSIIHKTFLADMVYIILCAMCRNDFMKFHSEKEGNIIRRKYFHNVKRGLNSQILLSKNQNVIYCIMK